MLGDFLEGIRVTVRTDAFKMPENCCFGIHFGMI